MDESHFGDHHDAVDRDHTMMGFPRVERIENTIIQSLKEAG